MTLTHRLIFIDGEANTGHQNMSNPDKNPAVGEADSQMPPKKVNFLDQVSLKVQFTKEVDGSVELADALYSRVNGTFPERGQLTHNILESNIVSPEKIEHKQHFLVLPNFLDSARAKQLYFEPAALVIRQREYTTFDEFHDVLKTGINAFEQVYGTNTVKQAELRYIFRVELSGDPLKWKDLIKRELISLLEFPTKGSKISRAMNLIELAREGCNVRFQSGLWNRDYPQPVTKREFILDYACYSTNECEIKQVPELADKFHTEIKSLFNHSVLTALKTRLGEI
jgi:uncharacterized protein (TIGR04255 family)